MSSNAASHKRRCVSANPYWFGAGRRSVRDAAWPVFAQMMARRQAFSALLRWLACALISLSLGCAKAPSPIVVGGPSMGTTWSAKIVAPDTDAALWQPPLQQQLDAIETAMSTWRADSEVTRFNRAPAGCYSMSAATREVVHAALAVADQSGGAFDISVAPLVRRWGFGETVTGDTVPSDTEVASLLAVAGYQQLWFDGEQLCKRHDALEINLSAIAKGYAVDQLAMLLIRRGVSDFLVEVGGELYAQGSSPAQRPWTIGVEQPVTQGRAIMDSIAVPIANQGVATSGDYRNYFERDGKRYSHILNPVTGRPVTHQVASVTVVANSAMLADAWATALLVLGQERGLAVANAQGLAVLMIAHAGADGFTVHTSTHWHY